MTFLRTALNAQRKARGEEELIAAEFLKLMREKARTLNIDAEMLKRPVNVGFSGGEKKRNEILQMAVLEPRMCILDETDSGLDVDAMKLVADGVNALRAPDRAFLVITHYQRLLDHITPTWCISWPMGGSCRSGGPELALEVEKNGYADILRRWPDGGTAAEARRGRALLAAWPEPPTRPGWAAAARAAARRRLAGDGRCRRGATNTGASPTPTG